ncbi:helix-turn-helix domain-containing protein [Winogradskyella forsetii]|uniref:helix-turn-helix domain-containing protein n=1 Tax=Winogradskyella forsetii TaxID=2686077 RepID=UPI0015B7A7DE|nr:helix-turn-helix transcriptional regulator [Winogradskyella forsetii]
MHSQQLVETIKARREMLNVTQEMLAALSGVGLRTLKQFESGKGNPTLDTLQKLGDALGMEITFTVKEASTK